MERSSVDESESFQSSAPDASGHTPRSEANEGDSASNSNDQIPWLFRHTEIVAAILLAIATVATAWCAYQSSRWNGEQATSFAEAATIRSESNREFNLAIQLQIIDTELFSLWEQAHRAGDDALVEYYEESLMRPELLQHLDGWVPSVSDPGEGDAAHPLVSEAYLEELVDDSQRLQRESTERSHAAKQANQTSDDYVLATVIFASVLFFAGIASKFSSWRIQGGLIVLGFVMFVSGAVWIASLPVL